MTAADACLSIAPCGVCAPCVRIAEMPPWSPGAELEPAAAVVAALERHAPGTPGYYAACRDDLARRVAAGGGCRDCVRCGAVVTATPHAWQAPHHLPCTAPGGRHVGGGTLYRRPVGGVS